MTKNDVSQSEQRRYLDGTELAERLGLSVKFLRNQRHLQLPSAYARVSRRIRYPVHGLDWSSMSQEPAAAQFFRLGRSCLVVADNRDGLVETASREQVL